MELLAIICIALLAICGWLCYENDRQSIQIKRDEQWKVAADRKIRQLEAAKDNAIEYALKVEMEHMLK